MNSDVSQLRHTFARFWEEIRSMPLNAGQPRNEESTSAVTLAREAVRLATEANNDELMLEAEWMLAHSLTANEQDLEAIPYYARVVLDFDARGSHQRGARIPHNGYISALTHAGRYDEALQVARSAEHWMRSVNDEKGYARLCTNIGNLHQRLDQYQKAFDYYADAVQTFEAIGDNQAVAQVCQNLGYVLGRLDRFDEADAMYERAEQISRTLQLHELENQARYNRAYLYFLRGRYREALQSYAHVRESFRATNSQNHLALCEIDEAEIFLQLNIPGEAATFALSASEQFSRLGMVYEEAKALAFYGVALQQMQQFSKALETFETSRGKFAAQGNRYWVGVLDLYRAELQFQLNNYWEAHSLAIRALQQFEALAIPSRRMLGLVLLGRIALALKHVQNAEEYVAQIVDETGEPHAPLLRFPYYLLSGQIAEEKGEWDAAEAAFRSAVEDLEMHEARLQQDHMRITFLHGRDQAYESLVSLSLKHPHDAIGSAYSWCERAKSRILVEILSAPFVPKARQDENPHEKKARQLREELNVHYLQARPEMPQTLSKPAHEAAAIKEQELARTLREIALNDPGNISTRQGGIALETVQASMPQQGTILEYFVMQGEVLAFVISSKQAKVFPSIASMKEIRDLQKRLAFHMEPSFVLREKSLSQPRVDAARHYLHALYKALIEPVIATIETEQITIIPHGTLHFLPFHAFFDGQQYLTDRFEIGYVPSAAILRYCMEKAEVEGASPLVVGVSDESAPMVELEVRALQTLFPSGRTLSGTFATREAFFQGAERASFVHVATHAVFRPDNPMFSTFKLADGYVTALDLLSMSCETNLVTLSGCKSGVNEVRGSDELVGLMRGFLYAGARSLLLSLWNVSDESTVSLMREFYKQWSTGSRKAFSLQHAMREVRRSYPHPAFWAPFILIGKP